MNIKLVFTPLLLLFSAATMAQMPPLLKAGSDKIAIREGNGPITRFWDHLNPKERPVVYSLSKNRTEKIIFYTDIDSITFTVSAGHQYDFQVLLNGKDTCYAELSTLVPAYTRAAGNSGGSDTIPFRLGADNYIHLEGRLNGSASLDLIFDSGASTFVLTEKGLKKVKLNLDGSTENEGSGGFSTEKTSSNNRLQLAGLTWTKLALLYYNYHGGLNADGVVGFNLIENKALEINYDQHILVLHGPGAFSKGGYAAVPIHHGLEGTFFPLALADGKQQGSGWFLFDTGGGLALLSSVDLVNRQHLNLSYKGKSNISGTGAAVTASRMALVSLVLIGGFNLPDVPAQLEPNSKGFYGNDGIAGNLLLKRFNVIIDYPDTTLYLKPNGLVSEPYQGRNKRGMLLATILFAGLAAGLLFIFRKSFKRKRTINRNLGELLL